MSILKKIPDFTADREAAETEVLKVAVVGACIGAGTSYISARILKKGLYSGHTPEGLRTLCELGVPYFYLALGFDKRFAGRKFYEYSSQGKHLLNMELGYNWYVKAPGDGVLCEKEILKKVYGAPGSMIVYDCSGLSEEEILFDILEEMDIVYLVIDPMPTKLISSQDTIQKIRSRCPSAELVINKYAKGIHRGELSSFLGTRNYICEDYTAIEKIYKAEYNCTLPE